MRDKRENRPETEMPAPPFSGVSIRAAETARAFGIRGIHQWRSAITDTLLVTSPNRSTGLTHWLGAGTDGQEELVINSGPDWSAFDVRVGLVTVPIAVRGGDLRG